MNNQFATQFLREDVSEFNSLRDALYDLGADAKAVEILIKAVELGHLTPEKVIEITKQTIGLSEDGGAAAAGGGGSTTGGGVTNGATWTSGAGEQMTGRKKAFKEDAPRLAGSPAKTNKKGAKNLSAYSSAGFTKAPSAEEAGKHIKGVEVEDLWEYLNEDFKSGDKVDIVDGFYKGKKAVIIRYGMIRPGETDYLIRFIDGGTVEVPGEVLRLSSGEGISESRRYSQFKKEAATRSKPEQMHQAAKIIHSRLEEITKLLEFAQQMRSELSEGEDNLEYKHNTKKVFEKINSKVVEVYSKVKSIS